MHAFEIDFALIVLKSVFVLSVVFVCFLLQLVDVFDVWYVCCWIRVVFLPFLMF